MVTWFMKSPLKPNFMSPHIQCATDNMEHLVHYENFAAHTLQILIYFTQKKFIKAIAYNFLVTAFLWNKQSSRIWSMCWFNKLRLNFSGIYQVQTPEVQNW